MSFEKLLLRNQQIGECLRAIHGKDPSSLRDALGRPYRELLAAQERVLNAAEQLADSLRRMG